MCADVERMTSTPNSQSAAAEGSSTAGSDKKRNKLGYHRTSVACVHCRRRKIRCLVSQDDAQGRCENCIRLRKECQYLSVDQQPPVEKKSRPNSRVGSTSVEQSTASLSPSTINVSSDQRETLFPYQPIPLTSNQEVPATAAGTFGGTPMAPFTPDRNVGGSAEFAAPAPPSLDPSVPWDEFTTISDPQTLAAMKPSMMNIPPNVWNTGGAPIAPMPSNQAASGTPSVPRQSQATTMNPGAAPGFAMQPDGSMWPMQAPPPPSMAFPTQPEMTTQYPAPFPPNVPPEMKQQGMAGAGQGPPVNNPQAPLQAGLPPAPVSVSYPGHQPPMNFPAYQDMSTMSPLNVVPYPMFSGDATPQQQHPNFTTGQRPPMGHPAARGQGHRTSRP